MILRDSAFWLIKISSLAFVVLCSFFVLRIFSYKSNETNKEDKVFWAIIGISVGVCAFILFLIF